MNTANLCRTSCHVVAIAYTKILLFLLNYYGNNNGFLIIIIIIIIYVAIVTIQIGDIEPSLHVCIIHIHTMSPSFALCTWALLAWRATNKMRAFCMRFSADDAAINDHIIVAHRRYNNQPGAMGGRQQAENICHANRNYNRLERMRIQMRRRINRTQTRQRRLRTSYFQSMKHVRFHHCTLQMQAAPVSHLHIGQLPCTSLHIVCCVYLSSSAYSTAASCIHESFQKILIAIFSTFEIDKSVPADNNKCVWVCWVCATFPWKL